MKIIRRKSLIVKIGDVKIGGCNPVAIQSMAKHKTSDIEKTVTQLNCLKKLGCEIARVAIKDTNDARAIKQIKNKVKLPIVADIHFDWHLAIEAIESGVDKIRLNPGNIYKKEELKQIVSALKSAKIPLRVGLNSGSLKCVNSKHLSVPDKLVASALNYIRIIEKMKYHDIVVSLKASSVLDTVEAYRKMSKLCEFPLHLGVTATGAPNQGTIKSSIAIGALLMEGIGDTIRISLTEEPGQEVAAAKAILESLNLRHFGPEIISCPTCGRCEVDLVKIVKDLDKKLSVVSRQSSVKPLKVAVMGCVVNGPGEAREADVGVAFGKSEGLLFRKGRAIKKIAYHDITNSLLKEMEQLNA